MNQENQTEEAGFAEMPIGIAKELLSPSSREQGLKELYELDLSVGPEIASRFLSDDSASVRNATLKILQASQDAK